MAELSKEAKEERREYQREYRRKHPEKQKEYTRRYWEKKGGKMVPDSIYYKEGNMIKCTMNIEVMGESLEDIGEQVRRIFPETKTSAMETDHSTHSDTDSISQSAQEVQEGYAQLEISDIPSQEPTAIEKINALLEPFGISVSLSGDKSAYKIGCRAVIEKWYLKCDGDDKKFLEPILIDLHVYDKPSEHRFDGRIMRLLIDYVSNNYGRYYHKVLCKNLRGIAKRPEDLIDMIKNNRKVLA